MNSLNNESIQALLSVGQMLFTFVVGVVGFFMRRSLTEIDSKLATQTEQIEKLLGLQGKLELTQQEITYIAKDLDQLRNANEKIAVISRDLQTAWRQIDDLKNQLENLRNALAVPRGRT